MRTTTITLVFSVVASSCSFMNSPWIPAAPDGDNRSALPLLAPVAYKSRSEILNGPSVEQLRRLQPIASPPGPTVLLPPPGAAFQPPAAAKPNPTPASPSFEAFRALPAMPSAVSSAGSALALTPPRMEQSPTPQKTTQNQSSGGTSVLFGYASSTLAPQGHAAIQSLLGAAKQADSIKIQGAADPSGNPKRNDAIALARAHAVRAVFMNAGIAADKIAVSTCSNCAGANPNEIRRARVDLYKNSPAHAFAGKP